MGCRVRRNCLPIRTDRPLRTEIVYRLGQKLSTDLVRNSLPLEPHLHMAHLQLGSFLVGLASDWARFWLGSILIALLPNDLTIYKWQAVKQHLDDHLGPEFETSRVVISPSTQQTSTQLRIPGQEIQGSPLCPGGNSSLRNQITLGSNPRISAILAWRIGHKQLAKFYVMFQCHVYAYPCSWTWTLGGGGGSPTLTSSRMSVDFTAI